MVARTSFFASVYADRPLIEARATTCCHGDFGDTAHFGAVAPASATAVKQITLPGRKAAQFLNVPSMGRTSDRASGLGFCDLECAMKRPVRGRGRARDLVNRQGLIQVRMNERGRASDDARKPAWIGSSNLDARTPCEMHDHGIEELRADHADIGGVCIMCCVDLFELCPQPGKVRG
jgi:hypothetical protein